MWGCWRRAATLISRTKLLGAERMGQLLVQDLEGDWPIVLEIAREVDRSHAAPAELALERVAVGQSGREPFQGLGQRDLSDWGVSRL
jgi:hypothetical protein